MRLSVLATIFIALAGFVNAQGLAIGSVTENFTLPGYDGRTQTLSGLRGENGAVIVFLSARCQAVRSYRERINQIAARARASGINFIGVNSNPNEPLSLIATDAVQSGYQFPVLIDRNQTLADRLAARTAPEVFFINGDNVLQYHGAIDNDRTGNAVTDAYLTTALDSSLTGKPVLKKTVQPQGCPIARAGND